MQTAEVFVEQRADSLPRSVGGELCELCKVVCGDVALDANGYNCRATPVVGYVKTMGVNVNTVLSGLLFWSDRWSSFTKDHDFVKIQFPDKTVYVDASMKDIFGTSQKQTIENE